MKKFINLIPFISALIFSVVTVFVYSFAYSGHTAVRYIQIAVAPLVALIIPLVNRIFKINIPFALNVLITIHAVLALDLAAALDFYSVIPHFDKFLHCNFGLLGSAVMFVLMLYFRAEKMNPFGFFLVIFLSVLGVAALWEIWEFFSDAVFGTVCQGWQIPPDGLGDTSVQELFDGGYHPLYDTMWDIIVTAIGSLVFFLLVLLDRLSGYKVIKSVYSQIRSQQGKGELKDEGQEESC